MQYSIHMLVVSLAASVCACAGHFETSGIGHSAIAEQESSCARNIPVISPYRMPLADPVSDPAAMATLDVIPAEARRTARAAGLEPLLVELLRERAANAGGALSPRELALHQELTLRLLAFDSQLTSLSFETECTRRHIGDIASTLDAHEARRQFMLATASLVIGAGTGISAGVLDLAGSQSLLPAVLAVAGGILGASLGIAVLAVPAREVVIEHRHNLLRPIQAGNDPEHFYPSFVFRMLNAQYPGDDTTPGLPLRADFDTAVSAYGSLDSQGQVRHILFGDGGPYSRPLLATREYMLHRLQFAVQGVARSLELLDRSLVKLLTTPAGAVPPLVSEAARYR